jgi:hypothetical protein
MVSLGMFPKEKDFCQLKGWMEMMEVQLEFISKVMTWLARKHGGIF